MIPHDHKNKLGQTSLLLIKNQPTFSCRQKQMRCQDSIQGRCGCPLILVPVRSCVLSFLIMAEVLLILTLSVNGERFCTNVLSCAVCCGIQIYKTFYWHRSIYNFDISKIHDSDLRICQCQEVFFSIKKQWLQCLSPLLLIENSGKIYYKHSFKKSI